jgi:hypothetical protein
MPGSKDQHDAIIGVAAKRKRAEEVKTQEEQRLAVFRG